MAGNDGKGNIKKIWITGQGVISRPTRKELLYKISLKNIPINIEFSPCINLTHISMDRETLIMFIKSIPKDINKEYEIINMINKKLKDKTIIKTEQEITHIINEYEKDNPSICGTDTLIKFIQWYDKREK